MGGSGSGRIGNISRVKRNGIIFSLGPGVIVLAVPSLLVSRETDVPRKTEKIRIGVFADVGCAPVYVGDRQVFFQEQGFELTAEKYQTGAYAV